jgi:glycosyltransferase involved in cell wall biosynthesis
MTAPARVLLVANTSWYLYNFRLPLLRDLRAAGHQVAVVAPADTYTARLEAEGFPVHRWLVARRSINPLLELRALVDLMRIYQRERPDLVHHFTIKACLYGTLAAKLAPTYRVINAITGLGHVFLGTRRRTRLLRRALKPLYRAVFTARRARVVFQNADDQEQLIKLGLAESSRTRLIPSSGVDIHHFQPAADTAGRFHPTLQLLFPSRLIGEKGVRELLEACQLLWADGVPLELLVAGDLDAGNRSSLSTAQLSALRAEPRLRCLGHVDDMRALYAASDIVVLPSWREGLSRALIEAAAMERPIITTDVPGCRDVVDHGRSGLLVPLRSGPAIALAIRLLLENPDLARRFGQQARRKVVDEFRVSLVNEHTLQQYAQLLATPIRPSRLPWRPRPS